MLKHYLTIAFRNMRKYKSQTVISIVGLAVGFTCFALATLWIRYEMTYDSFHKDADRLYAIYTDGWNNEKSRTSVYPMPGYLKETFPEVEDAMSIIPPYSAETVIIDGAEYPASWISADSSVFRFFDIKMIEGSRDFLIAGSNQRAITQEKARQFFGNESPVGKTVNNDFTICAVVSGMPGHSNYNYDFIAPFRNEGLGWNFSSGENTVIKLLPGTDVKAFAKKFHEHVLEIDGSTFKNQTIAPVTQMRYLYSEQENVKFQHILIFAVAGLLVILCSLFNYLTLFVSRFRIRQKELALRRVCGASGRSLLAMLSVEFLLSLLFAVVLGCALTQSVHKQFLKLAEIHMSLPAVYLELLGYIGVMILVAFLVFWLVLIIFQKRSLNVSIRRSNKKLFRKTSVIVQLVISIGFAFCTMVMLKQLYFLHHTTEIGFSFQNRATVVINGDSEVDTGVMENHLKQIPEITETLTGRGLIPLIPVHSRMASGVHEWDDKPADAKEYVMVEIFYVSPEYLAFWDFQLAEGEWLTEADRNSVVLINEAAVKNFGWKNPVGKCFGQDDNHTGYEVKGVVKNVYNFGAITQARGFAYRKQPANEEVHLSVGSLAMLKYEKGKWKACKKKIEEMLQKEYPGYSHPQIWNAEEAYDDFLKSETALIKLLSIVSAVCLLICVFGFVSLVSLTCEERRKEIAVRKINGATSGTILSMFSREYFTLLIIGALIAFPAGYYIMHRWLEQYVRQTSISAWIYLVILSALALIIVLCVGWQVYKASVENPAHSLKGE